MTIVIIFITTTQVVLEGAAQVAPRMWICRLCADTCRARSVAVHHGCSSSCRPHRSECGWHRGRCPRNIATLLCAGLGALDRRLSSRRSTVARTCGCLPCDPKLGKSLAGYTTRPGAAGMYRHPAAAWQQRRPDRTPIAALASRRMWPSSGRLRSLALRRGVCG